MTRAELTAICDAYEREQASKHWSDQTHHHVIERSGAIVRAFPAHQDEDDPDGPPAPEQRRMVEQGSQGVVLDREYHVPHDIDIWKARGLLCWDHS